MWCSHLLHVHMRPTHPYLARSPNFVQYEKNKSPDYRYYSNSNFVVVPLFFLYQCLYFFSKLAHTLQEIFLNFIMPLYSTLSAHQIRNFVSKYMIFVIVFPLISEEFLFSRKKWLVWKKWLVGKKWFFLKFYFCFCRPKECSYLNSKIENIF